MPKEANDAGTHQDKRRIYNPVQKDAATFLETSEETGGARSLIKVEVASGGGTSPPFHKTYAEHFEVIEGSLEALGGDETRVLRAGQMAVVPKNRLHASTTPSTRRSRSCVRCGRVSPVWRRPSKSATARENRPLPTRRNPEEPLPHGPAPRLVEIRVSGVFTLIELLMRFLAKRARRKGIDRKLEAKYC